MACILLPSFYSTVGIRTAMPKTASPQDSNFWSCGQKCLGISCYLLISHIYSMWYKGMDKIMDTVVNKTHFFINMELGHHLPVIELVSFLEQTQHKEDSDYSFSHILQLSQWHSTIQSSWAEGQQIYNLVRTGSKSHQTCHDGGTLADFHNLTQPSATQHITECSYGFCRAVQYFSTFENNRVKNRALRFQNGGKTYLTFWRRIFFF